LIKEFSSQVCHQVNVASINEEIGEFDYSNSNESQSKRAYQIQIEESGRFGYGTMKVEKDFSKKA
jgi:hypothetical protein